ncbi:MAG: hypothetical protein LBQ76_04230 [Candidatus Fibromonas sp.]|jgi:hypothetical protein|nr:hypothetical protein [Candidatus Fibromonas sp.]
MTPKHLAFAVLFFAFFACSGDGEESGSYDWVYDGETVEIGTQIWMAKNLNYDVKGSKCYNNSTDSCAKYGRLYNWQTAMKVCPNGWHLPSSEEWDKLLRFVDGDTSSESPYGSKTAGKHLRATSGWNAPYDGIENLDSTITSSLIPCPHDSSELCFNPYHGTIENFDTYGFSALPAGLGNSDGSFSAVGYYGIWWSASEFNRGDAYCYGMFYNYNNAYWGNGDKPSYLLSIRCVKD